MVIGAGPAGLLATHALQRLDIPVVLVDSVPAGGALNLGYDFENPRTGVTESSLDLRDRLLSPWGRWGPPLIRDRVFRASWKRREQSWEVQMVGGNRTVSWLITATGVAQRPCPFRQSKRVVVNPIKKPSSAYHRNVEGERVAILGGGDGAFEFAESVLHRGGEPVVFMKSPKARNKFVSAVPRSLWRPAAQSVQEQADGVYVNGECFDVCYVFYGYQANPVPLVVNGVNLPKSSDSRYPSESNETKDLNWFAVGDARSGAPWSIEEAVTSSDAAVARISNSLRIHSKFRQPIPID